MLETAGYIIGVIVAVAGLALMAAVAIALATWIIQLLFVPFVLHNRKKTQLHYFDHPDRYFDYELGQWQAKTHSDADPVRL